MQEMPQEGAQQQQEGGGGDASSQVGQMVQGISSGLQTISQIAAQVPGTPPQLIKELADISDRFQNAISQLAELGGGEQAAPEQGGSRAVPMQSAAGKPVSPAGV